MHLPHHQAVVLDFACVLLVQEDYGKYLRTTYSNHRPMRSATVQDNIHAGLGTGISPHSPLSSVSSQKMHTPFRKE